MTFSRQAQARPCTETKLKSRFLNRLDTEFVAKLIEIAIARLSDRLAEIQPAMSLLFPAPEGSISILYATVTFVNLLCLACTTGGKRDNQLKDGSWRMICNCAVH